MWYNQKYNNTFKLVTYNKDKFKVTVGLPRALNALYKLHINYNDPVWLNRSGHIRTIF